MDHILEDSLPMESIENIEFDHSGVVVNQEDVVLEDGSQASDIPMDLDANEEPTLLDGGSEEIIVSDFIGDQFGFQEYSMHSENSSGANITIDANQLIPQTEQVIDLQYADCSSKATTSQSNVITIKAIPQRGVKKCATPITYPRQVAIAPKPIKGAPNVQYAIAPKPVAVMMNKNVNVSKSIPVKNVVQGIKGNTVLAQIGKQLVMMPAGAAGQKIKLTGIMPSSSSDSNIQYAQLISNKGNKPLRTKFIVQASQASTESTNQPAMITKLVPVSGAPTRARYVMQQKTVPISIGGNKVVLANSAGQAVKVAPKKQIISIKAQSPKVGTSQANVQTKKVVITANPPQNQDLVLKTAGVKTGAQFQAVKDTQGQTTQIHPINVPGKVVQFIKLVTNQNPAPAQKVAAPKATTVAMSALSGKSFVWTDNKGHIIHMQSTNKISSTQPPPLLMTASATPGAKGTLKTTKKLVRIAPITHTSDTPSVKVREASKMAYCLQPKQPRASQSLLISQETNSVLAGTSVSLEEFNEMVDQNNLNNFGTLTGDVIVESTEDRNLVEQQDDVEPHQEEPVDIKPTLGSLISEAVAGEESIHNMSALEEIEIEYENTPRKGERFAEDENTNSLDHERPEEQMMIQPSNVHNNNNMEHNQHMYQDDSNTSMEERSKMSTMISVEADVMPYLSPQVEQSFSDSVLMFDGNNESGLRPRKACNCTKSQCLKLYCDCFANGEFCNKCNCNNCHNNLENEELRQKAIRACLDRNPNAFRPKIGKGKIGGPEIIRRHNKGCNCKRSGCLKNYCECYEAKIACTLMCKCVGCRNIEETLERRRDAARLRDKMADPSYRPPVPTGQIKQPCSFMTPEVIEAVAKCMLATATVTPTEGERSADPLEDILLEFSRCMADIINASHQAL